MCTMHYHCCKVHSNSPHLIIPFDGLLQKLHDTVASNLLLVGELAACTNTIVSVNLVEHVDLDNLEFCVRNYSL